MVGLQFTSSRCKPYYHTGINFECRKLDSHIREHETICILLYSSSNRVQKEQQAITTIVDLFSRFQSLLPSLHIRILMFYTRIFTYYKARAPYAWSDSAHPFHVLGGLLVRIHAKTLLEDVAYLQKHFAICTFMMQFREILK